MSIPATRLLPLVACALALAAGCAMFPKEPPPGSQPDPGPLAREGEGWLFDRMTGRDPTAAAAVAPVAAAPAGPAPSGVIPASAVEPVAVPPGPPPGTVTPLPPAAAGTVLPPADGQSEKKPFELSDLAPEKVYKNTKAALGFGPDEKIAREAFAKGQTLFQQKKYAEAAKEFHTASWRWPDSSLQEDAMFMLGESYFFSDQYSRSKDTFDNLLKKYTNSRHLDTVVARQFAIGRYWEQLHFQQPHWPVTPNVADRTQPVFDTFGNAIAAYDSVRLNDPTGPLADDSIMATANAYFRKGRYEEADYHYDLLRKEYPQSEHQLKAHLVGLQCKRLIYQGAMYDGKPLDEAEKVAKQTLTQFRSKLGPEAERVVETANELRDEQARRRWEMGQFYERKKLFGAARFHYQALVAEFPQSSAAQAAQARLEAIKNEPDEPPNHFKWLTDLFPEAH